MELETRLRDRFVAGHPADAARLLESMPASDLADAIADLPVGASAELLRWLAPYASASALELVPAPAAARALGAARRDAAAAVLRAMDAARRAVVLESLSPETRKALQRLLRYAEGTAGALMDPSVLSVSENVTAEEALERLRRSPQHALYYVYVVSGDQRLVGVMNIRELMAARPDQRLGMVAILTVESLPARSSWQSIVAHPAWKRFHALPVVEADGRLLGALRYEAVRTLEARLLETRLDDGSAETAAALGELYGLTLKGLFEWAASALLGSSESPRSKS